MPEKIFQSSITVFLTFFVFIIGQIIIRLVIEPYQEYKNLIGKIETELLFLRNKYESASNIRKSDERIKETKENSDSLRRLAGNLKGAYNKMGCKWLLFCFIPRSKNLESAAASLVFLSNTLWDTRDYEQVDQAYKNIKIKLKIKSML